MKKSFDYKWVILVLCFLVVFCSLGFCSGTKSLYLTNITKYLGIKRSLFSINDSIRYITTAILSIFFGTLYAKLGARKLIGMGFVCLIVSCLIYSYAENIGVFYIGGFFLGAGLAFCSSTIVGFIVNLWFKTNIGTYTGIVLAANGIGTAVITQFLEPMIDSAPDGYKSAYRLTALLLVIVGVIIFIFLREKPKTAEGSTALPTKSKRPKRSTAWVGMTLREASKKPYFYIMLACMFFTGAVLQAIAGISIPHIKDVVLTGKDAAYDTNFITITLSLHAICLTAAKFISGVSYDHLGLKKTCLIIHTVAFSSILMLAAVTPGSYTLAFVYEMIISFAMPLETIIPLLVISDMFGEKEYAKILGINTAVITSGYAAGTPLMNLVYDKIGTYRPALFVVSGIMFVVLLTMQIVFRKGEKVRNEILSKQS